MTKLYEIHREQQEKWTKEKLASMTEEQKTQLINLVKYVNPQIFEIKNDFARNSWIRILAGVYLRMLHGYHGEDYNSEKWMETRKKMEGFDITPLLYEKNFTQTPFNERGVVREEVLNP